MASSSSSSSSSAAAATAAATECLTAYNDVEMTLCFSSSAEVNPMTRRLFNIRIEKPHARSHSTTFSSISLLHSARVGTTTVL